MNGISRPPCEAQRCHGCPRTPVTDVSDLNIGGLADEIVALALDVYVDPEGLFLREVFDESWRPVAGDDGRLIEPGHQFEWAWLLMTWSRLRPGRDVSMGIACLDRDGGAADGRFEQAAVEAAGTLWRYLEMPVPGLWRDKQAADGGFIDEPSPASSLYHILGAVLALQTWSGQ